MVYFSQRLFSIIAATALIALSACSMDDISKLDPAHLANTGVAIANDPTDVMSSDVDAGLAVSAGMDLAKAATLSEQDVKNIAKQFAAYSDSRERVAGPSSKYTKRLNRLVRDHIKEDGLNLNFKVYIKDEVNAFAMADGTIRVYSGLMDSLDDDELLGVIGHEIGHVKNKDSDRATRVAYLTSAARKGVASSNSVVGTLAASQIGGMVEAFLDAQHSQAQETAADEYAMDFMLEHDYDAYGLVRTFEKFAAEERAAGHDPDSWRLLSTHPAPGGRADHIRAELKGRGMSVASRSGKSKASTSHGHSHPHPHSHAKSKGASSADKAKSATSGSSLQPSGPTKTASLSGGTSSLPEANTGNPVVTDAARGGNPGPRPMADAPQVSNVGFVASGWYVQTSAETTEFEATNHANSLTTAGHTATTQAAVVDGVQYYRVLVGPYRSQGAARADMTSIKSIGVNDGRPFVRSIK